MNARNWSVIKWVKINVLDFIALISACWLQIYVPYWCNSDVKPTKTGTTTL